MQNEHESLHAGVSRRTMVKVAAWSAPVVAVAVATPAAAASTTDGVDLFTDGLQQGSGFSFFSTDLQTRYMGTYPGGFTLLNYGPQAAPAGSVTVQVRYDNRMLTPTEVASDGVDVPFSTPVADGNASTYTFVVPQQVEVETDVQSANAIRIITRFDMDVEYPNDTYDDYVAPLWTIISTDDTDSSNNIHGPFTLTSEPAEPWGLTLEAQTSTLPVNGCSVPVAASVTVVSVGPFPTPQNLHGTVYVDSGLISSVAVTSATVNGVDITTNVTIVQGGVGVWDYDIAQPLGADDELELAFAYTGVANGTPSDSSSRQVNARGTVSDQDVNARRTVSYATMAEPVCAP